ncbi:MAG: hypothetical protein WCE82_00870 [Halobacteriota archaeon]
MSVILTLTATTTGGAMTSTTSGIALPVILEGAAIASIALLASLVATELLSSREGWTFPFRYSKKAAAAVLWINVTLLIIFCVSVAFNAAQLV